MYQMLSELTIPTPDCINNAQHDPNVPEVRSIQPQIEEAPITEIENELEPSRILKKKKTPIRKPQHAAQPDSRFLGISINTKGTNHRKKNGDLRKERCRTV